MLPRHTVSAFSLVVTLAHVLSAFAAIQHLELQDLCKQPSVTITPNYTGCFLERLSIPYGDEIHLHFQLELSSPASEAQTPSGVTLLFVMRSPIDLARMGLYNSNESSAPAVMTQQYSADGNKDYESYVYYQNILHTHTDWYIKLTASPNVPEDATAELTVYVTGENVTLAEADREAMQDLNATCCGSAYSQISSGFCKNELKSQLSNSSNFRDSLCHSPPQACDNDGHLLRLVVGGRSLLCESLPLGLSKLSKLTSLDLSQNAIGGSLEAVTQVVGNMSDLQYLSLDGRYHWIKGTLDCGLISALPSLRLLDLDWLDIDGTLQPCYLQHPNLRQLFLSATKVGGEIPDSFNGSKLDTFLSAYANFQGTLPPSFSASNLEYVILRDNYFTGSIPPLPASLKWLNLNSSDGGNSFQNFPDVSQAVKLQHLNLNNLGLMGTLPASLSNLTRLQLLSISDNYLSGAVPPLPDSLVSINMDYNSFNGTLPALPAKAWVFNASVNQFDSNLTEWNVSLANGIMWVDLTGNRLTGMVPASLASSQSLRSLTVRDNRLNGPLTTSWSAPNLTSLDLSNNQITGSLPEELTQGLEQLQLLDVHHNLLSGNLSAFTRGISHSGNQLQQLMLAENTLTGTLPAELDKAALFRGDVTIGGSAASNALDRVFNVSFNNLTGPIPSFMLDSLSSLHVACDCRVELELSGGGNAFDCPPATTAVQANVVKDWLAGDMCSANGTMVALTDVMTFYDAPPSPPLPPPPPFPEQLVVEEQHEPLSTGAIAGIAVGVVAAASLLAGLGYFVAYRTFFRTVKGSDFHRFTPDDHELAASTVPPPPPSAGAGGRTASPAAPAMPTGLTMDEALRV